MIDVKMTRTPEAWAKVDPLYLMQRVAKGETIGTTAHNLMRDALADIAALTQRCRELEEQRAAAVQANTSFAADHCAMVGERDALRAEVVAYQAALADERGRHITAEMNLRAEVERLREIRKIASQCAANGGYLNSLDLIDLRNLLEATK